MQNRTAASVGMAQKFEAHRHWEHAHSIEQRKDDGSEAAACLAHPMLLVSLAWHMHRLLAPIDLVLKTLELHRWPFFTATYTGGFSLSATWTFLMR
jgi:hypothetical protein